MSVCPHVAEVVADGGVGVGVVVAKKVEGVDVHRSPCIAFVVVVGWRGKEVNHMVMAGSMAD